MASPTLLFDGDCGFCTSAARWGERHLAGDVRVVPWQRTDLGPLRLTAAECGHSVQWVDGDRRASGARAIGAWLTRTGGAWTVPGVLTRVPPTSWIAAGGYALIARFRHRLPGGTPACRTSPTD